MKPNLYLDHVQWLPGPKPGEVIVSAGSKIIGLGPLGHLRPIHCPRCDYVNDVSSGYCWHCDFEFDVWDVRKAIDAARQQPGAGAGK